MKCLYCQKRVIAFRLLGGGDVFCSDEHKELYRKAMAESAIERILKMEAKPKPKLERKPEPKTIKEKAAPKRRIQEPAPPEIFLDEQRPPDMAGFRMPIVEPMDCLSAVAPGIELQLALGDAPDGRLTPVMCVDPAQSSWLRTEWNIAADTAADTGTDTGTDTVDDTGTDTAANTGAANTGTGNTGTASGEPGAPELITHELHRLPPVAETVLLPFELSAAAAPPTFRWAPLDDLLPLALQPMRTAPGGPGLLPLPPRSASPRSASPRSESPRSERAASLPYSLWEPPPTGWSALADTPMTVEAAPAVATPYLPLDRFVSSWTATQARSLWMSSLDANQIPDPIRQVRWSGVQGLSWPHASGHRLGQPRPVAPQDLLQPATAAPPAPTAKTQPNLRVPPPSPSPGSALASAVLSPLGWELSRPLPQVRSLRPEPAQEIVAWTAWPETPPPTAQPFARISSPLHFAALSRPALPEDRAAPSVTPAAVRPVELSLLQSVSAIPTSALPRPGLPQPHVSRRFHMGWSTAASPRTVHAHPRADLRRPAGSVQFGTLALDAPPSSGRAFIAGPSWAALADLRNMQLVPHPIGVTQTESPALTLRLRSRPLSASSLDENRRSLQSPTLPLPRSPRPALAPRDVSTAALHHGPLGLNLTHSERWPTPTPAATSLTATGRANAPGWAVARPLADPARQPCAPTLPAAVVLVPKAILIAKNLAGCQQLAGRSQLDPLWSTAQCRDAASTLGRREAALRLAAEEVRIRTSIGSPFALPALSRVGTHALSLSAANPITPPPIQAPRDLPGEVLLPAVFPADAGHVGNAANWHANTQSGPAKFHTPAWTAMTTPAEAPVRKRQFPASRPKMHRPKPTVPSQPLVWEPLVWESPSLVAPQDSPLIGAIEESATSLRAASLSAASLGDALQRASEPAPVVRP